MSDSDIREKFGTGWIGTGSGSADERRGIDRMDSDRTGGNRSSSIGGSWGDVSNPAFLTLGKQMIRFMSDSNGEDRLLSLASKMKLEPQDLSPVVEWLANNYYVRVEADQFGDHMIRLTSRAKELLSA